MLFERGHAGQHDSLLHEERHAPLDGFGNARAGLMHQLAQVCQQRLRKWRGRFNVYIHPGIELFFHDRILLPF